MKKKNFRTIIRDSKMDIEALKRKFKESAFCKTNRFSGGEIIPLYDADSNQKGWWLAFDCPEAFSITGDELKDMETFINDYEWMCEGFRYVKAWVFYDGSCHIWFEIFLDW